MTVDELISKLTEKSANGLGQRCVYIDTPAGALPIDEVGGGHDTFEGIFVSLRSSEMDSAVIKAGN